MTSFFPLTVFATVLAIVIFRSFPLLTWREYFRTDRNNTFDIVIGVLSARHHFEERQSLRNTWVGYIQEHALPLRVLVKFIIGDKECSIPAEYRISPYSCKPSNLTDEAISDEVTAVLSRDSTEDVGIDIAFPSRISFRVQHPIIIRRLGVFCKSGSKGPTTSVSVKLYDDINEEDVAQVSFSPENKGVQVGDYLFKPIESFVLPKDFEGSIIATSLSMDVRWMAGPQTAVAMETGGNVITFLQLRKWADLASQQDGHYQAKYNLFDHPLCNFVYTIHEPEKLVTFGKQKREKYKIWSDEMRVIENHLEEEEKQHGDIIRVETADVYENIPVKMLLFHKWLSNSVKFRYFIKTDDDCFLNIHHIIKVLTENTFPESGVWWGNFRYNWAVQHHGKWAELRYPSESYPAFACGSGNVISKDIVHWIDRNSEYLHPYQGEDVSMAIWLAAVLPTYIDDKHWVCDEECHPDMLVSAEHSVEEVNKLWKNWMTCGNPCECDKH